MTAQQRGTIIKTPDSTPGLLIVTGQQKPFTLEGVWKSPAPPAVNMQHREGDAIDIITGETRRDLTREWVRPASALMVVLFVAFCCFPQWARASITTLKPAPVFSASTVDGKTVNLADQKGKAVVLHFWSDRAPAGEGGMPYMQRLSTDPELAANGVVVWAVTDSYRTQSYLQNYAKSHGYTFDILYDTSGVILKAYDVESLPSTVVIGPDGIVRRYVIGWGPQRMSVDNAIQEILSAYKGPGASGAPQISMTTIDGQPTNLARQIDKVVLIHFWSPDESLSRQSLAYIQELAANAHLAGEGLMVWTVAESRTPQALKDFLKHNKYTFSTIDDSNHATMQSYGILRIPTTILVGKDGTISAVSPGWFGRRDARVANSVDQALTGFGSGSRDRLVGRHAPSFSLDSLDGKRLSLGSQRGKVVVLGFWDTWSTPGQWALPHLQQLGTERGLATNGLVVWGVAVTGSQMSEVSIGRYMAAKGYTFAAAYDAQHSVQSDYCDRVSGSEGNLLGQDAVGGTYVVDTLFPVIVVIGRDGIVKNFFTSYGGSLNELVDHAVGRALAEPPDNSDPQPLILPVSVAQTTLAGPDPAVSLDVQPSAPPAPSSPANPTPSSAPTMQETEPVAAIWQSDAYPGQTFRFRLNGNAIEVYGSRQEPLGTLEGKEKRGVIDLYQGLVQIGPLTQCPGGRGLMQIKAWNESRLDAKIETPVNGANGITCGGVMGMTRLIPWRKLTFVKNTSAQQQTTVQATSTNAAPATSLPQFSPHSSQADMTAPPQASPPQPGIHVKDTILYRLFDKYPYDTKKPFAVQYPRVALTIVSAPPNHAERQQQEYGGGFVPGDCCFTLKAKVWSSAKSSQDVGPFQWCSPQDLPKDFQPQNRVLITPCDGCGPTYVSKNGPTGSALAAQRGVRNRQLYIAGVSGALFANYLDHSRQFAVGDDTTGTQRTDGPVPPDLCIPTDPPHTRYYASDTGGFNFVSNDGGVVLLMFDAMDLDLNIPSDRRAWIVRFIPATE